MPHASKCKKILRVDLTNFGRAKFLGRGSKRNLLNNEKLKLVLSKSIWACQKYFGIHQNLFLGPIDGQGIGVLLQKWFYPIISLYATIFHPSFETNFSKSFFATYEKFAIVSIDHNDFMAIIFDYIECLKIFNKSAKEVFYWEEGNFIILAKSQACKAAQSCPQPLVFNF